MRNRGRALATAIIVAAAICVTTTSAIARTDAKPALTIGLSIGPPSLDPAKDVIGQSILMHGLAFATITRLNPDGSITGDLATSFRFVGKDPNKRFQFTLRRNARFADGTPVTAEAVANSLQYWLNAKGPFSTFVGKVHSVEAIGRWTVLITFEIPNPNVARLLSQDFTWGVIQGPTALANPTTIGTQTDGAGPYTLDPAQTVTGDHYTYVPNGYYWDKGAIKWGQVVVKVIRDPSSMLQAVQTGQIDVAAGDVTTASAAKAAGFRVHTYPAGSATLFLLDRGGTQTKALGDLRVRQALNYAVDRRALATALTGGYGTPTSVALTTDGFSPNVQNYYGYNLTKAKALLAAAGFPDGFTLKTVSLAGNFPFDQLTQAVAGQLSKVGVALQITTAPTGGQFNQMLFSGTFSAAQFLGIGYVPMWLYYTVNVKPKAPLNPYGYDNPAMDKLWLKASRLSPAAGARYWQDLSRLTVTQAWNVPLVTTPGIYYVGKRVGGFSVSQPGGGPNAPVNWYPGK
jgi:peptide/nickel transport system substrate-binding protein